jgi:FKBP-type peptidyl-prolyl cis-trans isomerase FkpA
MPSGSCAHAELFSHFESWLQRCACSSFLTQQKYRDGGRGVFRPLAFRLSGFPQPGVCEGLQQAIVGMKIGGQRSVLVPPQLGFGGAAVLAPYAGVPANSVLRYDVELVRVSAKGPDAMMKVRSRG